MPNYGDTRADGYRFVGYYKARNGTRHEHWLNPGYYARRKKRSSQRTATKHKARMKTDPVYAVKVRTRAREEAAKRRKAKPEMEMWTKAKTRARKQGLAFNLSVDDISIPSICPVLGIPMTSTQANKDNCPSLDRVVNGAGYVKGNVIVVSLRANRIKRDATLDEIRKVYEFYRQL